MTGGGGVLVVGEAGNDVLRPVSFGGLGEGRQDAAGVDRAVVALMKGESVGDAARQLGADGGDRVLVADDDRLKELTTEAATAVVAQVVRDLEPEVVLMPGTTAGRDYAPRLAARLGTGLAADCVELAV